MTSRFLQSLIWPCALALAFTQSSVAGESDYPLASLPKLKRPTSEQIAVPEPGTEFAPGVQVKIGQSVILTGTLIIDQGPVDGLEVLACLATGKTHESLVRLDATNGQLVKAAMIAALGLEDGVPAVEGTGEPGRGTPIRVRLEWEPLDEIGTWYAADATCLIRDRLTDQPYPPLPFIYTGSRFLVIDETSPDGRPVKKERFMLENTKSVAVIVDEPDALLSSPSPGAGFDKHFEVNGGISPPPGSKVRLVFSKVMLPLQMSMDASGALLHEGKAIEDATLQQLFRQHYGADATPSLRAVGILVDRATDRAFDIAAKARVLAQAAAAQTWVVPVFTLAPKAP